jgi:tRNA(fMet)-specific endonuclease VapC
MSLYVFDTDTLSLYQHGHPAVVQQASSHLPQELAITVISVEEQLSGWYRELRKAKQPARLAAVYQRLAKTVQSLSRLEILSYTEAAIQRYRDLQALKPNIGKMDLRIAAIVLENGATLVTRNTRDFQRVPGLTLTDWSL